MGNFKISDTVFRQIIEYLANKSNGIHKINKVRIETLEQGGIYIYIEVIIIYGYNVLEELKNFKKKSQIEIEKLTAMNVNKIDIIAKGIYMPQTNEIT
jgi:uncharacterized alkaline shock family protein YloU